MTQKKSLNAVGYWGSSGLMMLFCLACMPIESLSGNPAVQITKLPTTTEPAEPEETSTAANPESSLDPTVNSQINQPTAGYFIIEFNQPPDQALQTKLAAAEITLFDFFPAARYYAHLSPKSGATATDLLQSGLIKKIEAIPVATKLDQNLQQRLQSEVGSQIAITVQFFEELSTDDKVQLESLVQVDSYSFGPVNFAEGTAMAGNIEKVAALNFVKRIEGQTANTTF